MKTQELEQEADTEIEEEQVQDIEETEAEETTEQPESQSETDEQTEKEPEATEETETEDDDGELLIEVEGDSPPQEDDSEQKQETPEWVKRTRKENRDLNKTVKQQQKEIEELKAKLNPEPEIPPEPDLWSDEINGDQKKYAEAIRKRDRIIAQIDAKKESENKKQEEINKEFRAKETAYSENRARLSKRIPDYNEVVEEVETTLSDIQKIALKAYFDKPEALVYAIGKKPERLQELAAIEDPMKFGLAVQKLESTMKVTSRKPTTQPEETPRGQSRVSGYDVNLAKLEKEAKKTGDRSKVIAYKLKHGPQGKKSE